MPTSPPPRILIIYAHPAARQSRANRAMLAAAAGLPNVKVHDLYEMYPDFHIDVAHEQQALLDADLIIIQHPLQWYSMPALLKEWSDLVLQQGWAFGADGEALHGKDYWLVQTTGGDAAGYADGGMHGFAFEAFLPPFRQTARLCGMRWLKPLVLHAAHRINDALLQEHVALYRERLATYPDWSAAAASDPESRHGT